MRAEETRGPCPPRNIEILHQTRWKWNEKPFLTKDQDGKVVGDDDEGYVLVRHGAPLKNIWGQVRYVHQSPKKNKRATTAK